VTYVFDAHCPLCNVATLGDDRHPECFVCDTPLIATSPVVYHASLVASRLSDAVTTWKITLRDVVSEPSTAADGLTLHFLEADRV
jgi:hypothetical protein